MILQSKCKSFFFNATITRSTFMECNTRKTIREKVFYKPSHLFSFISLSEMIFRFKEELLVVKLIKPKTKPPKINNIQISYYLYVSLTCIVLNPKRYSQFRIKTDWHCNPIEQTLVFCYESGYRASEREWRSK